MDLKEAIQRRHSIRHYKTDAVPEEILKDILKRAKSAPSAGGLRAYRVIVTDKILTSYKSPVSLVVCALPEWSGKRYGERGRNLYAVQDATIYAAYIQLLAVDAGLDTVWVGAFRESKVKQALELDDNYKPVAIIVMGYAA